MILSYNVSYIGNPFDTLNQSQSFAVSLSYPATACVNVTLTGLEEFNNYTVSVQAVNSAGSGVSSAGVIAQTDAAGKYISYITIICIYISPSVSFASQRKNQHTCLPIITFEAILYLNYKFGFNSYPYIQSLGEQTEK